MTNTPPSLPQPSDTTQLLTDAYPPHYGATTANGGPHAGGAPQLDPEEIRRQRDALERLCAQTSEYVFPLLPLFLPRWSPLPSLSRLPQEV